MFLHTPLEFLQVIWGFSFLRIIPFPYLTGLLRKSDNMDIFLPGTVPIYQSGNQNPEILYNLPTVS